MQTGTHTFGDISGMSTQINNQVIYGTGPTGASAYSLSNEYGKLWTSGDVDCNNLLVRGAKAALVPTEHFGNRTTYCEEATEIYFFDRGEAQLGNGVVTVELDTIFLETVTIDDAHPMLVQVTLLSDCNGVYVSQRTATSFTVKELVGGSSNARFMWEVAAKRKGYEDIRLEEVE